jgi:serine phosphatase RsbU (regulator of sigma subunit)/anti-sigma regulatory factor (Ser/Thr protein kinase)
VTVTAPSKNRRIPSLRLPNRQERRARKAARKAELEASALAAQTEAPPVEIDPHDPVLAYFQSSPEPVDIDHLKLDTPGVRALREAGIKMVVPLVTQGELIGLLNLGERLSEQEYSADDRKLLENLAGQAAPALRVAQLVREQEAEVRRRERYEQEMRVAQLIQQNFLPKELPTQSGWGVTAFYRPAREVGGDFYDFVELEDGNLGVVVGDVTDKGVPAALVMASTRGILRSAAQQHLSPGAVLAQANDQICPDIPDKMFVTCLYGVLEPDSGRFRFANAGHNLPCVQTDDGAVEVRATGMPLGLLEGMAYEENEVVVGPGKNLLLYSDALPEAHAPDGEMFGFPQLVDVVGRATGDGDLIDRVLDALHSFTGEDWEQEDDITVVALRRSTHSADSFSGTSSQEVLPPPTLDGETVDAEAAAVAVSASTVAKTMVRADEEGEEIITFTVPSEPGNERGVMERVGEAVADLALSEDRLNRLKTAVAEATMNAIEHGNLNRSELHVEVRVFTAENALIVRITDQALSGHLHGEVDTPDIDAKLRGDQSPRGWGLFLIRNMVDDMKIIETEDHHVVDLILRLEGEEG